MKLCVLLIAALPLFGGQSLDLASTQVATVTEPNAGDTVPWRVEYQISGWTWTSGNDDVINMNGTGQESYFTAANTLNIIDKRDVYTPSLCRFTTTSTNIKVRLQRNPTASAINGVPAMTFLCEEWNNDGTGYQSTPLTITMVESWPYTGGDFGASSGPAANIGFYRVRSTLIAPGSLSPVTASPDCPGAACLTELKLDGTLTDSSGNGNNVTLASPSYGATPGQLPFANITTVGFNPVLASVAQAAPLRAGNPSQLDGSHSFSMADSSSAVTYAWSLISGPSGAPPISWSSQTTSQPSVTETIFGDYLFQLVATDANSNTSTLQQHIGAVATDSNWVVIDAQPAFSEAVFGQQIAFGHNPWPYADWANAQAVNGVGSEIGTPTSGAFISADWNVPLYASPNCYISGSVLTCPNINLQTVFGGGTNTWVGNAAWPILWYNDGNNPGRIGRQPLEPSCQCSTSIPTANTMNLDITDYPLVAGGICTMIEPCQLATSTNWLEAINSGSGGYGYYDGATMFEAFHRRTGLDSPAVYGQELTAIEVTAPGIDQGIYNVTQARVNISRQWAEQQVYYPTGANFSTFQFGLRYWAQHWASDFIAADIDTNLQSQLVNGSQVNCYPYCIKDVREIGAALMDVSAAAYVETDPTWQTNLNSWLELAWNDTFAPLLQPDGHWDGSMGYGGSIAPVATFTNASKTVTAYGAGTFTSTQCGTLATAAGTVSITNGGTAVTGSGTNFSLGTNADILVVYGTFSGSYGKQMFPITINSGTSITTGVPINLDSNTGLSFQLNSNPDFIVLPTDTSANTVTFLPTSDWYTCTYVNSTTLTLDQNFQVSTRTGEMVFSGGDSAPNQGTSPYMNSFPAAGLALGGLVGTAHAAQMTAAAKGLYPYLSTLAWVPSLKGAYFEQGFGNCLPPFPLNLYCASPQQNARMFGVEPVRALSEAYLSNPNPTWNTFLTEYYGAEWGNPAYGTSPYSDGSFVDDCADGWTVGSFLKYVYQCFAMGSSASMPAALLGGALPAQLKSVGIGFNLASVPTSTHVIVAVTSPTSAVVNTTCTVSPCSVTVDNRLGSLSFTGVTNYYNGSNVLLSSTAPYVINGGGGTSIGGPVSMLGVAVQ